LREKEGDMGKSTGEKCNKCGKKVKDVGIRSEGTDEGVILCRKCLTAVYPEGMGLPAVMDKDGNLYFIDKPRNCMVIFFSYGEMPYAACTEVSLEEEECGCGFNLY
jgi:hypothetical protein